MKAYTMDLRERVMKVYDEDKWTIGQIAQRFKVGEWWIHKLKRQRLLTGGITPRKGQVGKPRSFQGQRLAELEHYVRKHPDATLDQIHEQLEVPCTTVTIHNTLRRLGYRFKKNAAGQRTRSS
jgi:transposase